MMHVHGNSNSMNSSSEVEQRLMHKPKTHLLSALVVELWIPSGIHCLSSLTHSALGIHCINSLTHSTVGLSSIHCISSLTHSALGLSGIHCTSSLTHSASGLSGIHCTSSLTHSAFGPLRHPLYKFFLSHCLRPLRHPLHKFPHSDIRVPWASQTSTAQVHSLTVPLGLSGIHCTSSLTHIVLGLSGIHCTSSLTQTSECLEPLRHPLHKFTHSQCLWASQASTVQVPSLTLS